MTVISADIPAPRPPRTLRDDARLARAVGIVATVLMLIGLLIPSQRFYFFRSYLAGYLLWLGVSVGCLAILMMHHLVGGTWGLLVRRIAEAAAAQVPLMALLFAPILLGVRFLYPWADSHQVAIDPILQHRTILLNVPFWAIRAVICFLAWAGLATLLGRWSRQEDQSPVPAFARMSHTLSAPGLVLFFVTVTIMAIDWIMSRELHWYSTIMGLLVAIGQGLSGVSFMIAMLWALTLYGTEVQRADELSMPLAALATTKRLNDMGNLLLTLVILWAYMTLAQFLVIWMGNTTSEITWYAQRGLDPNRPNGWRWFGLMLALLQFFVPFFLLLSKENKRNLRVLGLIALGVLVLRYADIIWLTAPTISGIGTTDQSTGGAASWMDVLAPLAVGGFWISGFVSRFESSAVVPLNAPQSHELFNQGGHHG